MNVSNLVLDEKFSNTIPLSLPEGCLVDVAQLVGIVPVSKGGTGADNISDAAQNLNVLHKDRNKLDNSIVNTLLVGCEDDVDIYSAIYLWHGGYTGNLSMSDSMFSIGIGDVGYGYMVRHGDPDYGYTTNGWNYSQNSTICIVPQWNDNYASTNKFMFQMNRTKYLAYGSHNITRGSSAYSAGTTALNTNCYYNQYS